MRDAITRAGAFVTLAAVGTASFGCLASRRETRAEPTTESVESRGAGQQLRLVSSRWSPFTDVYGNQHAALDVVDEALLRAGHLATVTMVMEGAVDATLQSGEFDGCPAIWRSPEREGLLEFSAPYLENRLVLLGRAGANVNMTTFEPLRNKRLGLVRGYAYGELERLATEVTLVTDFSTEENVQSLLDRRLDYVLADALVIHRLLDSYSEEVQRQFSVGHTAVMRRPLHFALRRSLPNAKALILAFEQALAKMVSDGSYHRALGVQWLSVDVTGDRAPELVPASAELGVTAPRSAYALMPTGPGPPAATRFFVAGTLYDSWQAIPAVYRKGRGN